MTEEPIVLQHRDTMCTWRSMLKHVQRTICTELQLDDAVFDAKNLVDEAFVGQLRAHGSNQVHLPGAQVCVSFKPAHIVVIRYSSKAPYANPSHCSLSQTLAANMDWVCSTMLGLTTSCKV